MMNAARSLASERVLELFDGASNAWPSLLECSGGSERFTVQCAIGADLAWFDGHFDQSPVLPGVVQTHWAGLIAQAAFAIEDGCRDIRGLKFHRLLNPGASIIITLSRNDVPEVDQQCVSFLFQELDGEQVWPVSEGKLTFGAPK